MSEDKKLEVEVPEGLAGVHKVAYLRNFVEGAKALEGEAKGLLEQSEPGLHYGYLALMRKSGEAELKQAEADYRRGCVAVHIADPTVKKFPGGKIINSTIFDYSEDIAIRYAIDHDLPGLLKLDVSEFKKIWPRPYFFKDETEPKLRIDADLSEFLEVSDE